MTFPSQSAALLAIYGFASNAHPLTHIRQESEFKIPGSVSIMWLVSHPKRLRIPEIQISSQLHLTPNCRIVTRLSIVSPRTHDLIMTRHY